MPASDQTVFEAHCSLKLSRSDEVRVQYFARKYDPQVVRRMRSDGSARAALNQQWTLHQGIQLSLPYPIRAEGQTLPASDYRLALQMDDAGAFGLRLLHRQSWLELKQVVGEGDLHADYLTLSLTPTRNGNFAVWWRFGPEYGTVEFLGGVSEPE
jgi:hypothetical protein